ncbi:epidermal growth factor receptor kinase substrate 8-like protein 1 [Puma concolor]|uniref:Epidermal growth factor receptor kinase substrate 8-like protein 1 n=1 Tax=Puma concolor TaxID=9696 RepID=A0A6P6H3A8_PUMCO|nr:epidermal growth factor receptor kinase substrate 8-like protein 1 [Puma concolor]
MAQGKFSKGDFKPQELVNVSEVFGAGPGAEYAEAGWPGGSRKDGAVGKPEESREPAGPLVLATAWQSLPGRGGTEPPREQRKRYSTVVLADVSQYPVNHLVTFCLGEEDGVHTVEDASRRLAVMDNQGRVWAQEMLLRVSPDRVTLLDPMSKEELESYPLGAIVRCDVVTLPGRSRSLLLLVCQEPDRTQPDVHFFQGLRLGAELIREDIQGALHDYRSGRGERRPAALRATQEELQRRPSPAAETPPPQRRPSIRAVISTVEAGRGRPQAEPIPEAEESLRPRPGLAGTSGSAAPASPDLGPRGPDLASLQAEREVDILNHVFDDVESFVSKLQKSAEAARVLEQRERGRRTRRRAPGAHTNSLLPSAGRLAAPLSPTCVVLHSHQDPEPEAESQLEPEGKWVLCNYDFQARNSSELSVQQRDVLEVLDDQRKWWKVRDQRGQEGYVPYNILTPHPGPRASRSLENSTPPPPRAPAPASSRPTWDSCDSLNLDPLEKEKFSQMLCVNEELQARLAQGRSGPSRAAPGPRVPEPQLSPHSDASEVRAWLQAKGFSAGTVDALGVLTGAQLFSLQKEELRAVSPEEGARVYSQVTVQRALLEDKEKVSELEAVMEKQKKKVEGDMETEVI